MWTKGECEREKLEGKLEGKNNLIPEVCFRSPSPSSTAVKSRVIHSKFSFLRYYYRVAQVVVENLLLT